MDNTNIKAVVSIGALQELDSIAQCTPRQTVLHHATSSESTESTERD